MRMENDFLSRIKAYCEVTEADICHSPEGLLMYVSSLISLLSIPYSHSPDGTTLAAINA